MPDDIEMDFENRIVAPEYTPEDVDTENPLRPKTLADYIGQEKAKENLSIYIEAARGRQEALDHVLLFGPPGLGKTTLAGIIANEMNVHLRVTSGPAIEKPGDLAASAYKSVAGRCALYRRNSPASPHGGGDPLPGDGRLFVGHYHWQRSFRPFHPH